MSALAKARRKGLIGAIAVFLILLGFLSDSDAFVGVLVIVLLMSALAWWLIVRLSIKGEVRWRGKLPKNVRRALRKAAMTIDRDTVILDLETTGKNLHIDEPVEIGAVRLRPGGQVSFFWRIVNPGPIDIDPGAEATHGLSRDIVRRVGVSVPKAWRAFERFAQGAQVLVAYNATFDFTFMDRAITRYGTPKIITETRCALNRVKQTIRLRSYRLHDVVQHCLGKVPLVPHTALGDAALTAMVWSYLQSNQPSNSPPFANGSHRTISIDWRNLEDNEPKKNNSVEQEW